MCDVFSMALQSHLSYTSPVHRGYSQAPSNDQCYTRPMSKALEDDAVASALIYYIDEIPTPRDQVAIQAGRVAYNRGDFISLDQRRNEVVLNDYYRRG